MRPSLVVLYNPPLCDRVGVVIIYMREKRHVIAGQCSRDYVKTLIQMYNSKRVVCTPNLYSSISEFNHNSSLAVDNNVSTQFGGIVETAIGMTITLLGRCGMHYPHSFQHSWLNTEEWHMWINWSLTS